VDGIVRRLAVIFVAANVERLRPLFNPAQRSQSEDSPAKDDRPTIELEVVHPDDWREKRGRPLFLDARRFIRICHWI
jgi:hypothetical protein